MEITTAKELETAILQLKRQESLQREELVDQFHLTVESLNPVNLAKGALNKMTGGRFSDNVMDAALGVGAGILTKKLVIGNSANVFKKILGNVVEVGVANLVASNTGTIGNGIKFVKHLFGKKKKDAEDAE